MKNFENYAANLRVLAKADQEDLENEFILSGIIDKFCLQFDLAWKTLKEMLRYEGVGVADTGSPRELLKAAYRVYDFMDEDLWLDMLRERNNTSHIYNALAARELADKILKTYLPEFQKLESSLEERYRDVWKA